jgi:hypothetical protein
MAKLLSLFSFMPGFNDTNNEKQCSLDRIFKVPSENLSMASSAGLLELMQGTRKKYQ